MQVFQTAGDPPRRGRIILAIIGSTMKTSAALEKTVAAKSGTAMLRDGATERVAIVMYVREKGHGTYGRPVENRLTAHGN
jgi:hypothetical protein